MSNAYMIRSSIFLTNYSFGLGLVHDEPTKSRKLSIDFHVTSGDYFGTIATVLGLISEPLKDTAATAKKTLGELRDELAYMQEHYRIEPRE
jgi:hypothetical protein